MANELEIKFNPDKCTLLIFSNSEFIKTNINIMLCGSQVKIVNSEKHLGHVFNSDYGETSNLINMDNVIRDMKVRTNALSSHFKSVSWKSKTILFNSQCISLYGCHLWKLDDKKVSELCTTWKVCCRRLLNLNQRTRSHLIHHLMGTAPIGDIIMYRMLCFFIAGLNHNDNLISHFYKNVLLSNTSYMSANINKIIESFKINYNELFNINKNQLKLTLNGKKGVKDWQCNLVEELLTMREHNLEANLDIKEIKFMLENVFYFR